MVPFLYRTVTSAHLNEIQDFRPIETCVCVVRHKTLCLLLQTQAQIFSVAHRCGLFIIYTRLHFRKDRLYSVQFRSAALLSINRADFVYRRVPLLQNGTGLL